MDIEVPGGFSLKGIERINVILGKNGCGKSYLLKQIEAQKFGHAGFGKIRYISPERGGVLSYEPGIEQAISNDPDWIRNTRRQNQSHDFRQQSTTLFRQLEILALREIEREHTKPGYIPKTFDTTVELINVLLDRIKILRDSTKVFCIIDRQTEAECNPREISSGESELISLGIEILAFSRECAEGAINLLLIDEPDVHLHPDLQYRLANFISNVVAERPVSILLATHSTSLLAGLHHESGVRLSFKHRGSSNLKFRAISEVDEAILPIFGAHPLSNVFNQAPALLVEGEDDERIWQQCIRSSQNKVRLHPCAVDGVDKLAEYENEVKDIIEAVYDNARAYSIRDRDQNPELVDDNGPVIRMRLSCRAAENLMLSDDVLASLRIDWQTLQNKILHWIENNKGHQYHNEMKKFADEGFDRKGFDLKKIRNILIGLMTNKPWEVLVGQSLANLANGLYSNQNGSLSDFLGKKVCTEILGLKEE